MPSRKSGTRPLSCHQCGFAPPAIDRGQVRRAVRGKRISHVHASCPKCGNEWWSRHPEALGIAKAADAAAKEQAA